ncbi:cytochrome P450 [Roseibium polysiphoniae]|uniref:cytochrome P450 n=1 Tax=Roseibium polysiphoniae TaxID=2571221 RepID=UPI003296A980
MRRELMPTLGRPSVERLRSTILIPAVDEVLGSVDADIGTKDRHVVEFMSQVAVKVPYAMITRLLGLPPADAAWLRTRVLPLAGAMEFPASSSSLSMALDAKSELIDYLKETIGKRRPGDDETFLDFLVPRDQPVDEAALSFVTLFMLGATETSVAAIGKVLYAVLANDVELSALANAEYRMQVIRETLRLEPPTHTIVRYASTDLELHGVEIPRRSTLLLSLGSASRDETIFSDPDTWRPGRPDQRLLAFSAGPHTCLGAQLALAEFDMLFDRLAARFAGIQRTDAMEDVRSGLWRLRERGHVFRQPDKLHVELLRHSEQAESRTNA